MKKDEDDEPCAVCLWTGVATCTGLSAYFGSLAFDKKVLSMSRLNKPIYLAISVGWVAAGAYRYSLG